MLKKFVLLVPKILTNSDFGPCVIWLSTFTIQLIEMCTFDPSACKSSLILTKYQLLNYLISHVLC